jgi:hypothetical protein
MSFLSPELAEKFAGYIVNRRDKRIITFSVLALYAATLLYHLVAPALGAPVVKAALDSVEVLAAVVVVAHIAGGTAQRAVAQRAVAQRAVAQRAVAAPAAAPSSPGGKR